MDIKRTFHQKVMRRKAEMHKKIAARRGNEPVKVQHYHSVVEAVMMKHGLTEEEAEKAIEDFGG